MKDRRLFSFLLIAIGLWQIAFPLTFFHSVCVNCSSMMVNDLICGALLAVLGIMSFASIYPKSAAWLAGIAGVWMQCAPVFFWANSPMIYLNDTLIGALAIIFCFQLKKQSSKASSVDCPRGWSYNPSSLSYRLPVVGLALLCWFFTRYMAAFQLGYINYIWDPFFVDGTYHVITSDVSKSFPVSDAGLGAVFYTLEALLGWQGDQRRWATMPWVVFCFAFLVIPVGVVSFVLIILQPVVVGAWSTWCLATAICMPFMIALTAGECAAALQFLNESVERGESFWRVFWKGGVEAGKTKELPQFPEKKTENGWGTLGVSPGITIPWNLALSAAFGILLLFLPTILQYQEQLVRSDYIVGPILFAVSIISMAEVVRILRFALVPLGAWILVSPWVFSAVPAASTIICHISIGLVLMLSTFLCKNKVKERYGAWESLMV